MIQNLVNQSKIQHSFIHIDATYKLNGLGLPLYVIGTENINHCFRPVAFFLSSSESVNQVILMLTKFKDFLQNHFSFDFQPKFILTENCDALITGCGKSFNHQYVHLGCHFHITKKLREKSQASNMKEKKQQLFYGFKVLKNSQSLEYFKKAWEIIKKYWKDHNIPEEFIKAFENEYGVAFPGKSRTNNSIESGNNVLKNFFNRKSENIKLFIGKMREFIVEWSTQDKTSFPNQIEF